MLGYLLTDANDIGKIRVPRLIQRRWNADGNSLAVLQLLIIGRGAKLAFSDDVLQGSRFDIGNIGNPVVNGIHLARIGVNAHDIVTCLGKNDRQRETNIPQADDRDSRFTRRQAFE